MADVTTAMSAAFTQIGTDVTAVLVLAIPIALTILGLTIAVRFGVRWFKSLIR